MKIYWLALDKNDKHTSYEEIKQRKVIAIGWRNLGDITTLTNQTIRIDKPSFKQIISILGDVAYKNTQWWTDDKKYVPEIFWKLFHIQHGDIIVAIEGTKVRGFCKVDDRVKLQYQWQNCYEYAHCIASCVEWTDWKELQTTYIPKTPSKGIKGIKYLKKERDKVENVINAFFKTSKV
jgi:Ni,Fe-hydrogenase I small subunit